MSENKEPVPENNSNQEIHNDTIQKIEEYDPFKHRDLTMTLTDVGSVFTLIKSSLGTGILAMPMAFGCAGIVTGTIGTLIIGLICTHCALILVHQSQMMCRVVKKPSLTYGETVREAFAHGPEPLRKYADVMRVSSDMAMSLTYMGICCVYVSLMANSIYQLMSFEFQVNLSKISYCFILMIPLILLAQIRDLTQLTPLSISASVFLIIVCVICLYVFLFDGGVSFGKTVAYGKLESIPLFFSTVIFAIGGIGVVLPVENRMKNPSHINGACGILNRAMLLVVFLYLVVGFFGYAKFGEDARGAITLNLDPNMTTAKLAKLLVVIGVLFTYPLKLFVSTSCVWKYVKPESTNQWFFVIHSTFLTAGVLLSIIIAAVTPNLEALMEFVGAVGFSTLGIFFPAMIETIFMWNRDLGVYKWKLWKNILIGVFALVALACGVNDSIKNFG